MDTEDAEKTVLKAFIEKKKFKMSKVQSSGGKKWK